MSHWRTLALCLSTCWMAGSQAQQITLPAAHPQVESCLAAAEQAESLQLQWADQQPCLEALDLSLVTAERISVLSNLALIQSRLGDFEAAERHLNLAFALGSDQAELYLNRGNLLYLKGDFTGAIRDYSEVIRRDAASIDLAYLNRGMAQQNLGRYMEAEADYRSAQALRPEWWLIAEKIQMLDAERYSVPRSAGQP